MYIISPFPIFFLRAKMLLLKKNPAIFTLLLVKVHYAVKVWDM